MTCARRGSRGRPNRCFPAKGIDVVVVGDSLSQAEGRDLLRRHGGEGGPDFILICRPADLVDKVLALELGAADVIESPLNVRELAARIGGLLARRGRNAQELIVLENATVDLRSAMVMHRSGTEEQLSPGQVALLQIVSGQSAQGADARRHHCRRARRKCRCLRSLDRFAHRAAAPQARHRNHHHHTRCRLPVRSADAVARLRAGRPPYCSQVLALSAPREAMDLTAFRWLPLRWPPFRWPAESPTDSDSAAWARSFSKHGGEAGKAEQALRVEQCGKHRSSKFRVHLSVPKFRYLRGLSARSEPPAFASGPSVRDHASEYPRSARAAAEPPVAARAFGPLGSKLPEGPRILFSPKPTRQRALSRLMRRLETIQTMADRGDEQRGISRNLGCPCWKPGEAFDFMPIFVWCRLFSLGQLCGRPVSGSCRPTPRFVADWFRS